MEEMETLHSALRVIHSGDARAVCDERRVRHYACELEAPIEEVAVSAVHDLLEELVSASRPGREAVS
jgi:hypothetical protein